MITDRRSILAGLAVLGTSSATFAQSSLPAPAMGMAQMKEVKTAGQYFASVLGPAELSLATSQLAVDMASTRDVLEFGGFELGEAITVNMVLKDLGTKSPGLDADAKTAVEKMKAAGRTAGFDRSYIAFQLENHEFLRNLAEAYLTNTVATTDPAEKHGRSLAALMLAVFKEHVAICKRISTELKA